MKNILLLFLLSITLINNAQRNQFGLFVNSDIPNKSIMPKMSKSIGFGFIYSYQIIPNFPLCFELKGNTASYAVKNLEQNYEFENGDVTQVNIYYKSAINKLLVGVKISTGTNYSTFRVFAKPQFGLAAMKSKIRIADPEDVDDCRPLEKKTTQRYNGFVYGGEVGFELSLNRIFTKFRGDEQHRILISANYLQGINDFEYVNINYMQDGDASHTSHPQTDSSREITGEFINVTTQKVHEHKIAELYKTAFNMMGISFGYIINF